MLRFHSLHSDQFILAIAEANLGSVCQAGFVFCVWRNIFKMIVMITKIFLRHLLGEQGIWQWFLFQAGIHACLVDCQRIGGRKHANIRQHWRIVATVAVAGW